MDKKCPCGSGENLDNCCGPFLRGEKAAPTAEALMRSRYVAYTTADVAYLKKTLAPESSTDFDAELTKKWAVESKWLGLQILSTVKGQASDSTGVVEFIATYSQGDETIRHHEISKFKKNKLGYWLFVDGEIKNEASEQEKPIVRESPKIGRNDPCHCGSNKKFKKCCGQAS